MQLCRTLCSVTTTSQSKFPLKIILVQYAELQRTYNLYNQSLLHFYRCELQYNPQLNIFRPSSVGTFTLRVPSSYQKETLLHPIQ